MELQHSIRKPVQCEGVGLHTGVPVTMAVLPAPPDHGVVFVVGPEHRWLQLLPAADFRISYTLDHEHPAVGVQVASFVPSERIFVEELAPARTYGFLKDLELLRQQGLALGGSLANAVVVGQER